MIALRDLQIAEDWIAERRDSVNLRAGRDMLHIGEGAHHPSQTTCGAEISKAEHRSWAYLNFMSLSEGCRLAPIIRYKALLQRDSITAYASVGRVMDLQPGLTNTRPRLAAQRGRQPPRGASQEPER